MTYRKAAHVPVFCVSTTSQRGEKNDVDRHCVVQKKGSFLLVFGHSHHFIIGMCVIHDREGEVHIREIRGVRTAKGMFSVEKTRRYDQIVCI